LWHAMTAAKSIGTLKFFNRARGFGIIEVRDGKDVFVHQSGLVSDTKLMNPGTAVSFTTEVSEHDPTKTQAVGVTIQEAAAVANGKPKASDSSKEAAVDDVGAPAKSKRQAKKEKTEQAEPTAEAAKQLAKETTKQTAKEAAKQPTKEAVKDAESPAQSATAPAPMKGGKGAKKSPREAASVPAPAAALLPESAATTQAEVVAKPQRQKKKAEVPPVVATVKEAPTDAAAAPAAATLAAAAGAKKASSKKTPPTPVPQSEETASTILKGSATPEKAEKGRRSKAIDPADTQAVQALVPGAKSVTVVDVEDEAHTKTFIFGSKLYVVRF